MIPGSRSVLRVGGGDAGVPVASLLPVVLLVVVEFSMLQRRRLCICCYTLVSGLSEGGKDKNTVQREVCEVNLFRYCSMTIVHHRDRMYRAELDST